MKFKELFSQLNKKIQGFDAKAAGKTVINTVKDLPSVAKQRKDAIAAIYQKEKEANASTQTSDIEAELRDHVSRMSAEELSDLMAEYRLKPKD